MTLDEAYEVLDCLGQLTNDPEAFVWFAFDWDNDPELQGMRPQEWQLEQLRKIEQGLQTPDEVIRQAVSSGHGIGKSALVAWIILWAISTFPDTRGVVTANTDTQLRTKTWPELAKWYRRFIAKDLFVLTATSIFSIEAGHERTWRIDAIPWSEVNPEAFAGLHNQGNRILLIFDEASAISDIIWEVAEGALTDSDTQIIWCAWDRKRSNRSQYIHGGHHQKRRENRRKADGKERHEIYLRAARYESGSVFPDEPLRRRLEAKTIDGNHRKSPHRRKCKSCRQITAGMETKGATT